MLISSAITAAGDKGAEKALHALMGAEDFQAFTRDEQLQSWKELIESEVEKVVSSFEEESEMHPKLGVAIMDMKSKYSITSTVSTLISEKNPDLIVIIKRAVEDGVKLSMRNQSGRVDLNALARKACKGIGTGGGHEKAAGAQVTDWNEFKKRFLKALK